MMNRSIVFAMVATALGCEADLAVDAVSTPPSACPGEDIGPSSSLSVVNAGSEDAQGPIHVAWYLSADDTLDAGDTLLVGGRDQVAAVPAGEEVAVDLHVLELPLGTPTGAYHLLVVVDETNVVEESDESNNTVALPFTVVSCAPECTGSVPAAEADERVEAIAVGPAGEVYVAGHRARVNDFASDRVDGFLRRMDPSATTVVWEAVIDHCHWDSIVDVGVSASGDPVVSGATRVGPFGTTEPDIVVRKYSPEGTLRWEVSPATPGIGDLASALAIDPRNDDIVVTGSTVAPGESFSTIVNRVSADGLVRFSYDIDPIPASLGRAVSVGPAGEIVLAGDGVSGSAYVASLTPEGEMEWVQTLEDPNADWQVIDVERTSGSIDVLSELFTPGTTRVPLLNRLSTTGARTWERNLTVPGSGDYSPPAALVPVGDERFVAGWVPQPRGSGILRPWLAHIDGSGVVLSTRILDPDVHEITGLAVDPAATSAYLSAQVRRADGAGNATRVVVTPLRTTPGALP